MEQAYDKPLPKPRGSRLVDLIVRFALHPKRLGYRILGRAGITCFLAGLVTPSEIDRRCFENPGSFDVRFLSEAEIQAVAGRQGNLFVPEFAQRALAKGDRCHGVLDSGELVSFTWYSAGATELVDGLIADFHPDYVYGYKSFTHPGYRGRRLHALSLAHALRRFASEGLKGVLGFVEAENYSSVRSGLRAGGSILGRVWIISLGSRTWLLHTAGCRRAGLRLSRP